MERTQARVTHHGEIEHGLQSRGKDAQAGGLHLKRGGVRGTGAHDRLQEAHLVLFGDMVGHMWQRWYVQAREAEAVLQARPHGGDPCGMPFVEERDNALHPCSLSAPSWAASPSPQCVPAMPSPSRWPAGRVCALLIPPRRQ